MQLRIAGGTVFDPKPLIRDIWINDGRIVAKPVNQNDPPDRTIDAAGLVVMAGAVDMHTHVAGPKVNSARRLRPDDRRHGKAVVRQTISRSGTIGSVPSTFATGALYAGLGYTTAIDAAIPPLGARQAQFELADTPVVDKGMLISLGDHLYAMELIAGKEHERLRDFISWTMRATGGLGVKLVNPGGIESYKHGRMINGLDEAVAPFNVTPRQILIQFADAVDELQLPHPVHVHCANLGRPGNWQATLESMKSLDGRRGHFTHIQFHSYGGGPDDGGSFCSRTVELAEFVNSHPEITVDVGQVLFGGTTALTGDSAVGHFLHESTGRRWTDFDTECEAGCGIVPMEYRDKSLVNALQWAIGLEWFLLIRNPWQIALTTDHPNGATFWRYPEIIHLLMKRDYRRDLLLKLPTIVRERSLLFDLDREYTLEEVAIITRGAPARILGLRHKGHLNVGADADVTIYSPNEDLTRMFTLPNYVIKNGTVIVENNELRNWVFGSTLTTSPDLNADFAKVYRNWFNLHHSFSFHNFPIEDEWLHCHSRLVECQK